MMLTTIARSAGLFPPPLWGRAVAYGADRVVRPLPLKRGGLGWGSDSARPSMKKMIPTRPPSAHSRCFASAFLARKDGGQGPPMLPFSRGGKYAAITCDCPARKRGREQTAVAAIIHTVLHRRVVH